MNSEARPCTVTELLPKKFNRMEDIVRDQIAADQELSQYRLPRFASRMLANKATQAVLVALNKNVFQIFPVAWSRAQELSEFTDTTKYAPDEDITLFLGEHEFEIEYEPVVNVRIAGFDKPLLYFTLALLPQIRGASITIRNGCIVSVGECEASVEAELKYLRGPNKDSETGLHTKLKSREVKLVEALELDPPGVRIVGDQLP